MAEVKLTILGEDKSGPARQGLIDTEKALGMVKAAAVAVGISFSAMMMVDYAKDAALLAARYNTLGVTMTVVGNNAGYTGEQMRGFQTTLQATGIAMVEARQNLTSMAQAHIDLSKSAQLARIAQDAAVIGGINSSEAFSRMVYGIQSAQVEVLRTIGLNVNFETSYSKLAKQIGKNAADLTEMEKVQARTNAVMEKGKDIAGAYEAAMGTAGKQITSMKRYMDDLKVKIGETFQDALTVAVGVATDSLKGLNKEAEDLAKKKQIDKWGQDALMAFAVVADAIGIVYKSLKTLVVTGVAGLEQLYYGAKAFGLAMIGDFQGAGAAFDDLMNVGQAWSKMVADEWKSATPFQDRAKAYLAEKDAALKNVDALKAQEAARMAAGAATRADLEAKAKQEIFEKNFIADLKNNITGIKDYASAMKDLGKERLALSTDQYHEKLKQEIDRYKEGKTSLEETIKPLKLYNTQVNAVYNERLVNERAALEKITGLYSEFKSKLTITANSKEVKQHGVEILKEVKGQSEAIIAVESDRYKTLIAGEHAYASKVLELIQAKKNEIKELQTRFEDANKSFEEKKRSALGDYSGGFGYLDPALDALAKRQAMIQKLRTDEAAYDQITDPSRKKEKMLGLIDAWDKLDQQIDLAGQTVVTTQQAIGEVQTERTRLQEKILNNAEKEKAALEATYNTAVGRIDQYKNKVVELDDLLKNLTRDITINLKVNGLEQIDRIQGIVGAAVRSPFSSPAATDPSPTAVNGSHLNGIPSDYFQVGDSFYWGDGTYGGPAYERGTERVTRTGLALVHEDEAITPAGKTAAKQAGGGAGITISGGITITLPNVTDRNTAAEIARQVYPELQKLARRQAA